MPAGAQTTRGESSGQRAAAEHVEQRKQRVLTKQTPSVVRSIADAVVIKDGDVFFLAEPDGSVPGDSGHGYGLYYHDCRFLNGYTLRLAGTQPDVLAATAVRGDQAVFELTNPDLHLGDGTLIPKEHLGITWERVIDGDQLALYDQLTFQSYASAAIAVSASLAFQAAFEDIFAIRGLLPEKLGTARPPAWQDGTLRFVYDGADGLTRSIAISFDPPPDETAATSASFLIRLPPREQARLRVGIVLRESPNSRDIQPHEKQPSLRRNIAALLSRHDRHRPRPGTELRSNSVLLNRVLARSLRDLRMLETTLDEQRFYAAGIPWFATLFGRDSLITALQTLAFHPSIAANTLRLLARYQGQEVNRWRDEQPGKILHELRVGELARLNEIPQARYYGTIDATILFLILVSRHAAWTGRLELFEALRPHIEQALRWMSQYGDLNGDGYIEYESTTDKGLINQGWKDSGDAIVTADGELARPPIALVEVQGYAYLARHSLAELYDRAGESERANRLRREADQLRARFNRDFWLDDLQCYALALQGDGQPCAVISSNPGQALWTGIIDAEKAGPTVQALMDDSMFSGWGVRTLSTRARRYNPIGYHLGTVWPHDNSIIAAGFRRYGFDVAFQRIITGITGAASHFRNERLPELFAGFDRDRFGVPVRYPVACHPQAWAAGSIPFLLETALGLTPEAFDHRLRIVRPMLPHGVDQLELRRLAVGDARVDLRFERAEDGIAVEVTQVDGRLDVAIEPDQTRASANRPPS